MDNNHNVSRFYEGLFQISVITLPYLDYASLCGLLVVLIFLLKTFKKVALDPLIRNGFLGMSGLMVLSAVFALHKGEAFLQLTNFLPFFLFFAILPLILNQTEKLEHLAFGLVLSAIPINLFSVVEYSLKSPFLPRSLQEIPVVATLRSAPHPGRAMVRFDHPNVLASYLVLMLGLGLGVILKRSLPPHAPSNSVPPLLRSFQHPQWLYVGTLLNLVGIFCSGSRNGVIVAVGQLLLFCFLIRVRRSLLIAGMVSVGAITLITVILGIGGRTVATDVNLDPRVGVWKIALDLMVERPLLGWGLGNYKFLYQERLINPEFSYIAHPHNLWLLLGCETGIPVMIGLTVLIGYICYRAVRCILLHKLDPAAKSILLGYLLAFAGCVTFAVFDITFYDARINVINWVILAGIYGMTQAPQLSTQEP